MTSERRSSGRSAFKIPRGSELLLDADGSAVNILNVQDLSPFGIGLQIDRELGLGSAVRFQYRRETVDIEVHGSIVWSSAIRSATDENVTIFRVGIYFQEAEPDLNVTFFNAMTAR